MNFDRLPSDKPTNFVVPVGTYKAKISGAQMKQPKDPKKPMYLSFKLDLFNYKTGEKVGSIFDGLYDSEANLLLYKLKRFMIATDITLSEFELSDLAKLINDKEILVDVKTEEQEGRQPRSVVDVTTNQIYYPVSEAATVFGDDADAAEDAPINASDSLPASLDDVAETTF